MPSANTLVRWVNENAFAFIVQARPCPTFGRPVHLRGSPHRLQPGTSPHALRIPPRDGHPALRELQAVASGRPWSVSGFRLRARLGFSIPSSLPAREALPPRSDTALLIRAPEGLQPSRSTRCSAHTMGLSDSRPGPPLGYVFPRAVGVGCPSPPCRVSQVPRLIFPCALSPTTPEGPTGACSLLPRRCRASSTSGGLATSTSVTRPNRVRLRYGSQVCFPGFHQPDCSDSLRFRYVYERAIYTMDSFQSTRSARLSLVYPMNADKRR